MGVRLILTPMHLGGCFPPWCVGSLAVSDENNDVETACRRVHSAGGWPGSGAWLWRGLMMIFVAAMEGILIGLVYTEIFTCLALKLAHMLNKRLWQDHEACVINFTCILRPTTHECMQHTHKFQSAPL
jgi:hypothetical protein